jgi:hypothetical protein
MKVALRFMVVFALCNAIGWLVMWIGGYDFNSRNAGVGFAAMLIFLTSALVAAIAAEWR